jgi:hypothetical protein
VSASSEATQTLRHEIPLFSNLLVTVSLEFSVTVCLADVEYSIACWERASSEAARRLEQIYLDDYATGRAAGALRVSFVLATEQSEQLRFLREAEERAIKAVAAKLQADGDRSPPNAETNPAEPYGFQQSAMPQLQQLQKWREAADLEARKGTNWMHEWASRSHAYQIGPALKELARIGKQHRSGN